MTIDTVLANLFQVLTLATAFIGTLSAWLMEHVDAFQKDSKGNDRSPLTKKIIVTALSAGLAVLLVIVASFIGPDQVKAWNGPLTALFTFGVFLVSTQVGHWSLNQILPEFVKVLQAFAAKYGPQG